MSKTEKKWYVVKTSATKETKVKNLIEKEALSERLKNKIGRVIVLTENFEQIRKGKRISRKRALYPGCIMLEVNLEGEVLHIIKNIPGVINFLSEEKSGAPHPLKKEDVDKLLTKCDELENKNNSNESQILFSIGEKIKIIEGPFESFSGSIIDINKETGKLKLEVMIFERATPLELNFTQVEKI